MDFYEIEDYKENSRLAGLRRDTVSKKQTTKSNKKRREERRKRKYFRRAQE